MQLAENSSNNIVLQINLCLQVWLFPVGVVMARVPVRHLQGCSKQFESDMTIPRGDNSHTHSCIFNSSSYSQNMV